VDDLRLNVLDQLLETQPRKRTEVRKKTSERREFIWRKEWGIFRMKFDEILENSIIKKTRYLKALLNRF